MGKRKVSSWKRSAPPLRCGRNRERPSLPSSRHLGRAQRGQGGHSHHQHGTRRYAHPLSPHSPAVPDELVRHLRRRAGAGHTLIHEDLEGQAHVGSHRRLDVDQLTQHEGGQGQAGGPGPWGQAAVCAWCHPLPRGPSERVTGLQHSRSYASRAKRRRLRWATVEPKGTQVGCTAPEEALPLLQGSTLQQGSTPCWDGGHTGTRGPGARHAGHCAHLG